MKGGKTGSRLLSLALCALIALLVIKLGLTVMGALHAGPGAGAAVPAAMAKEEKPQKKPPATYKPGPVIADVAAAHLTSAASLSALQQKENRIQLEEEKLRAEKQQLLALKKEVETKVNALLVLQKQVLSAQSREKSAKNSQLQGLARIYGTMKPKQAAKLMESLDDSLVKSIISTMPPDKAASILALMDVKKAAKISEALSGQ
ncbi:MAG: MotE family protein [Syntrophobacteraceae bacterium]